MLEGDNMGKYKVTNISQQTVVIYDGKDRIELKQNESAEVDYMPEPTSRLKIERIDKKAKDKEKEVDKNGS